MEAILTSPTSSSHIPPPPIATAFSLKHPRDLSQVSPSFLPYPVTTPPQGLFFFTLSSSASSFSNPSSASSSKTRTRVLSTTSLPLSSTSSSTGHQQQRHWMVLVEDPPQHLNSKPQIIDYYVHTLQRVLGRSVSFYHLKYS